MAEVFEESSGAAGTALYYMEMYCDAPMLE